LTLWKGCFSFSAYSGIKAIGESVIGEVVQCEKDIKDVNSSHKLYGHTALKFAICSVTTPIFSAVLFESVQSGIANEIGFLDLLKETRNRLTGYRYNYRTRLIPFWSLILPTSFYFMGVHFVAIGLESVLRNVISGVKSVLLKKEKRYDIDQVEQEVVDEPYLSAVFQLSSQMGALALLYPIETVINRLIVQGTRTIVDNTDNGLGVIPINTRYDGFFDCVQSILEADGTFGFYKGIGSLMIETACSFALLYFAKLIAIRLYDSEWTAKADSNKIQNLMTSGNILTNQQSITPTSMSPLKQRQHNDFEHFSNKSS
jgi:solute carrier family 25 protein 46